MNKIEFIDPPLWQVQRLAKWLNEWDLEMTLRRAKAEGKFAEEEPSGRFGLGLGGLVEPFDENVLFGEIRLLSSQLLPEGQRPVYVAIISDWMEGVKLVAPYGVFSEPASSGELLTGREHTALRVLCLWNSHTLPLDIIAKSWIVDRLNRSELEEAWAVFEHVTFGHPLPESLIEKVGPPITNRLDPRCQYQQEELTLMEPLASAAIQRELAKSVPGAQKPDLSEDNIIDFYSPWAARTEPDLELMAAQSVEATAPELANYAIGETQFLLRLMTQIDGKGVGIRILDQAGNLLHDLDGARIVTRNGVEVRIENGQAVCSRDTISGGFTLINSEGKSFKLKRLD